MFVMNVKVFVVDDAVILYKTFVRYTMRMQLLTIISAM